MISDEHRTKINVIVHARWSIDLDCAQQSIGICFFVSNKPPLRHVDQHWRLKWPINISSYASTLKWMFLTMVPGSSILSSSPAVCHLLTRLILLGHLGNPLFPRRLTGIGHSVTPETPSIQLVFSCRRPCQWTEVPLWFMRLFLTVISVFVSRFLTSLITWYQYPPKVSPQFPSKVGPGYVLLKSMRSTMYPSGAILSLLTSR